MAKKEIIKETGTRMLPMVTLSNKKTYFIDERLHQLRNIWDPCDYIDYHETGLSEGDMEKVMHCIDDGTKFITITCCYCDKVLFSGPERETKGLVIYCTDCAGGSKL